LLVLATLAIKPMSEFSKLMDLCHELGMDCFSSPFDETAVDFLENLNVPCYKIASFENSDMGLIAKVARTNKPIIMSSGMASLSSFDEAVQMIRSIRGNDMKLALLKCTSAYPASPRDANLRSIPHMAQAFNCPVGLSDHTPGIAVPVASVALGACIIEKHFILDKQRDAKSHDAAFSLDEQEFGEMIRTVRVCEQALGTVHYDDGNMQWSKRSLFVVKNIKKGERFSKENVRSIRPADGLHTRYWPQVLNAKAACDIEAGEPLKWDLLTYDN